MQSEWGNALRLTVTGASHDKEIGIVLKGLPVGLPVDTDRLNVFLARRRPQKTVGSTARREPDALIIRSGLTGGHTDGEPFVAAIENTDANPAPYALYRRVPRPSQIDLPARMRFGDSVDLRGGGHFSGRMTAAYCIAGGIALQQLERLGVTIGAHLLSVGDIEDHPFDPVVPDLDMIKALAAKSFPVLDDRAGERMQALIEDVKADRDSVGGVIEAIVAGFPAGHGTPLFSGIDSRLASLLFAVPAVRGVSFGSGFDAAWMRGSSHNDAYERDGDRIRTKTNRHGGVIGGISTGMPIVVRAAIKPAASIAKPQTTLDLFSGEQTELTVEGRHDACIAVRAVPVIEAVCALALYDLLLEEQAC